MRPIRRTQNPSAVTVSELRDRLADFPADALVKLCVIPTIEAPDRTTGGADFAVEESEEWPNAVVLFAEAEVAP